MFKLMLVGPVGVLLLIAGCGGTAESAASANSVRTDSKTNPYASDMDAVTKPKQGVARVIDLRSLVNKDRGQVGKILGSKKNADGSYPLTNGAEVVVNFESNRATWFQVSGLKAESQGDALASCGLDLVGFSPNSSGIGARSFKDRHINGVHWEQINLVGSPEEGGFTEVHGYVSPDDKKSH